jgi:uncharacterized protein
MRRVETPSPLCGAWSYEVWDTKLARSPKAKFLVQLAFYSSLLTRTQGVAPVLMSVVLGDGSARSYRFADYAHYQESLLSRFLLRFLLAISQPDGEPPSTPSLLYEKSKLRKD